MTTTNENSELREIAGPDLKASEVKAILGISDPQTFYRLCEEGKIPGVYRLGGQWRFHRGAFEARLSLEEWRERQKAAS